MRGLNKKMRWRLMAAIATTAIGIGFSGAAAAADFPAKAKKAAPSIWERDTLTGDWGGARTSLKNQGIDITLNYIGEIFGVMSGGLERRASYEGQLEFSVDTDLDKLIGWTGASTHVTIFQIHDSGHNVLENVGSIADPSNIDALPTTRLYTAWFEQKFSDLLSVRVGQLAGDGDFATGPTGGGLINGTFGWASLMAANITNGGPAYPLATPGVRIKVNATDNLTVLGAVFAGNPAGNDCFDDPQACDRYGTRFSLAGGALWMGEVQYKVNQGKNAAGLPGIYKLGAWYATADYPDQHFGIDSTGAQVSLGVDPTADPVQHRGDWGIYGVADQMVWRGHDSSMNLFVRGGLTPSDRNLISYYVDGGAGITGLLPGRANDVLTFGVAYAKISKDAIAADQDALGVNGPPSFIRDEEVVFELSYAAQVAPWWVVQPDLQYIVHPGGNVADPNDPNSTIQNAFIAGIRSTIKF
jgi:porin